MFQLPQLASLSGSLPHERRHSDGPDSAVKSGGYGRVGGLRASGSSSMRPPSDKSSKSERRRRKSESMAKKSVTKASELMYLVPHNKEEAKQYKSVLVFCDVKLKEGAARRRNTVDKGPDVAASAACCHVLDTLCDSATPPHTPREPSAAPAAARGQHPRQRALTDPCEACAQGRATLAAVPEDCDEAAG